MSSDGASIPFGRNWLKETEDALGQCKLMFVWMTPTSLASNWIPFESGFAYSKGIRVVPIGFQGVKLGDLPAPISILQGFDVANAQSLNNIIAIINEEFSLTFPDLYDDQFYTLNIEDVTSEDPPELLRYVQMIDCEYSTITSGGKKLSVRSNWHEIITGILAELEISFLEKGDEVLGAGFSVKLTSTNSKELNVRVRIDPLALSSIWKAWCLGRERLYAGDLPYTFFVPRFVDGVELPQNQSLIGARLLRSEVSFDTEAPHVLYRFRNIDFRFHFKSETGRGENALSLLVPRGNDRVIPLYSLLKLLEERHVIKTRT